MRNFDFLVVTCAAVSVLTKGGSCQRQKTASNTATIKKRRNADFLVGGVDETWTILDIDKCFALVWFVDYSS
jgi:hypothetical protein